MMEEGLMLDTTPTRPDRMSRKSVSFTDEQEVVDASGTVTMVSASDDSSQTAQSHKPTTPPLSAALGAFADSTQPEESAKDAAQSAAEMALDAAQPESAGGLDLKMKKKKKKVDVEGGDEDDGAAAPTRDDTAGLDLSLKKKKKKKATDDDFTAKLKELEIVDKAEDDVFDEAAMREGTGIWAHDESRPLSYGQLVGRFFALLSQRKPDHALSGTKSFKIPPPQCLREGNKKTILANFTDICKRMKRTEEHLMTYMYAELGLGTTPSMDGSKRLVIKGRFQQKQIEAVLRKYIMEYITCKTCRSIDTEISKGENRLSFITCNSCGSRRSAQAIKTGFTARVKRRKR